MGIWSVMAVAFFWARRTVPYLPKFAALVDTDRDNRLIRRVCVSSNALPLSSSKTCTPLHPCTVPMRDVIMWVLR